MITRVRPGKYVLRSHAGKKLGTFETKKSAVRRERQINYFKHEHEIKGK